MKIIVMGTGYVGLSMAVLLSQHNEVLACDLIQEKVDLINQRKSPLADKELEEYLESHDLNIRATTVVNREELRQADYIIIATPTNYDTLQNYFDTSSVDDVISKVLDSKSQATMVVKSTIPVGFIKHVKEKYHTDQVIFSPEFLREGKALYDNLYPSRIIVGEKSERAYAFAQLLKDGAIRKDMPILFTNPTEAEAIKLFANTYLAMRVAYFNELDTYAEIKGLDSREIIEGICCDPRIGNYYNNPSFGYGGYCLPKDTKQLRANFEGVPSSIIGAVVEANDIRKDFIATEIIKKKPNVVGVFRLTMKADSDNFRQSSIFDIIDKLQEEKIEIILYEPTISEDEFYNMPVYHDFSNFMEKAELIVANRMEDKLEDIREKVFTRDIYWKD